MASVLELAQLARAAYRDNPAPAGWQLVDQYFGVGNGYYGQAYVNHKTKELVIANRGTQVKEDILSDLALMHKIAHSGQNDAVAFAFKVAPLYKGYKIIETGHSLGGNLAAAAIVELTKEGYAPYLSGATFNSPGIGGWSHTYTDYDVVNYISASDRVNKFGGDHLGTTVILPAGPNVTDLHYAASMMSPIYAYINLDNMLAAHSIGSIVKYLETGVAVPSGADGTVMIGDGVWLYKGPGADIILRLGPDGQLTSELSCTWRAPGMDEKMIDYSIGPASSSIQQEKDGNTLKFTAGSGSSGHRSSAYASEGGAPGYQMVVETNSSKLEQTIGGDGSIDTEYVGHLGTDPLESTITSHFTKDGWGTTLSWARGTHEWTYEIARDKLLTYHVSYENGSGSVIFNKDGSADYTLQSKTGHFNPDGSGTWKVEVTRETGEVAYKEYKVDAAGEITGKDSYTYINQAGDTVVKKWEIGGGKEIYETYVYRALDGRLMSADVDETQVASDLVEESNGMLRHSASGILIGSNGDRSFMYDGAHVSVNAEGDIVGISLPTQTLYFEDDHLLWQWLGDVKQQVFTDIYENRTTTSAFLENGMYNSVTSYDSGHYNYDGGDAQASFGSNGNLLGFQHTGPDGSYSGTFSGAVATVNGEGKHTTIDLNAGTIHYSTADEEYVIDSEGNVQTFSDSGNSFSWSDGRTGTITHDLDADVVTTETYGTDGSRYTRSVQGNGDEDISRYDSEGNLQYHESITESVKSYEEYFSDGGHVEYRTEHGFGEERTYYRADGGNDYVRLNSAGTIVRKSTDLPSGQYETWVFDDSGTLEKHQIVSPDGWNNVEYFVGSRVYTESGPEEQGSVGTLTTDAGTYKLILGSFGNDDLSSDGDVNIYRGGWGDDAIRIEGKNNLLLFNQSEGNDIVQLAQDSDGELNLSLGDVLLEELSFTRSGSDLILTAGHGSITLREWYNGNEFVGKLQIILDSTQDYNSDSPDTLYSSKVQIFDFKSLVHQADARTDSTTPWHLSAGIRAASLGGSDSAAIGGALAYQHAHGTELSYLSANTKVGVAAEALVSLVGQPILFIDELPGGPL